MADCAFYDRACKVKVWRAVVQPCRLRLCPQTCKGRGKGVEREEGGLWRMGQASDQYFPGPVTVPEYS